MLIEQINVDIYNSLVNKVLIQRISKIVENELTKSQNNLEHTFRVANICAKLAKGIQKIDRDLLICGALLHDIGKVREYSDNPKNLKHSEIGAKMARGILFELNCEEMFINKVYEIVAYHSRKVDNVTLSYEAKIVHDADKLDNIGAIGIARFYMVAGLYNESIFCKTKKEEYIKNNIIGQEIGGVIKDITKHAPNIELALNEEHLTDLYIEKAKTIAIKRIKFMHNFFKKLASEIEDSNILG